MTWYEDEVERVEALYTKMEYIPRTVFYGSSSIRLWGTLYEDFRNVAPVNLGFGGSTLEACTYFFKRIIRPYHPRHIIIYAGDNDLGDGRSAAEVHALFLQLYTMIRQCFENIFISYVSVKPSLARWDIHQTIEHTNTLIRHTIQQQNDKAYYVDIYHAMLGTDGLPLPGLYEADGLHINNAGYDIWKNLLLTHISLIDDSYLI